MVAAHNANGVADPYGHPACSSILITVEKQGWRQAPGNSGYRNSPQAREADLENDSGRKLSLV